MRVILYIAMCSILLCPLYGLAQTAGDDWMAECYRFINNSIKQTNYDAILKYIGDNNIDVNQSLQVITKENIYWSPGTPFTILVENKNTPLWVLQKLLVEYSADPNIEHEGQAPLHTSVMNERSDLVHLLLFAKDEGAKPGEPRYGMKTANPSPVNDSGMTPLHLAAQKNLPRVVKYLLEAGASVEETVQGTSLNDYTTLHIAALYGATEATDALLARKQSKSIPFAQRVTPIHLAAEKGYPQIIKLYKQHNYDISTPGELEGDTPLVEAARNNQADSIWALLRQESKESSNRAQPNQPIQHRDYKTALHVACELGNYEAVHALLDAAQGEISIYKQDHFGNTPLMLAAAQGHTGIVDFILQRESKPDIQNSQGNTACIWGCIG